MKKIKNKAIRDYVMQDKNWKCDLPALLNEIQTGSNGGVYDVCFNILRNLLSILSERAIEINDPVLNIIMLKLSLYEGSHGKECVETIEKLRQIIKDKNL